MDEASVIDTFDLCWNAVLKESELFNFPFFNEEHCKILDSRDADFNKVENRLAYTYKFGYFNVQFVEKCISNFLDEYSGLEAVFPVENMKICSLSNGPGLDIVGLLCALFKSKKMLKCFPHLKALNLYDSWTTLYKTIVRMAYESICLKSNVEYFHIPSENICLIQSDIYSTITPEAEKIIGDSNVLLMVKTFVSTKATVDIFTCTLKKIFSLLKPGSLIFFIGTKSNTQKFSQDASLSCPVKCIYGPQKVTLKDLTLKDIVNDLTAKPQNSGYAYFIVWQKREVDTPLEVVQSKKKRKRIRRKKKKVTTVPNQEDGDIIDELSDDTDVESEVSSTSCSKQSDSLSDEMKDGSVTASDEINRRKLEIASYFVSRAESPVNYVISKLDKVDVRDSNNMELQPNMQQSINENEHNLEILKPEENFAETQSLVDIRSKDASMQQMKNVETTQNEILYNEAPKSMKECASGTKVSLDHLGFYQTMFPQVIQNKVNKTPNTPSKKVSKNKKTNKAVLSDVNAGFKDDRSMSETTLQDNLSLNQSPENITIFPQSVMDMQHSNGRNSNDVQGLIQRCENLITSLEKMADDMKRDISSRNGQCSIRCCCSERCRKYAAPCCCSCANNIQFYCRHICNCSINKNICTTCTNSFPHRSNTREIHECCCDTRRRASFSKPCNVIPLQHEL